MNPWLLSRALNATPRRLIKFHILLRQNSSQAVADYQLKYQEKLHQRAEDTGVSVSQLLEKAKNEESERRKAEAAKLKVAVARVQPRKAGRSESEMSGSTAKFDKEAKGFGSERKDAPPFKPLSNILDLNRLLSTPHTAEQISALWTAYHASRSGGTGRGYVCASIPLPMFQKMAATGRAYPSFLVALPRVQAPDPESSQNEEEKVAYEFYYLQWDFHAPPEIPSADPFAKPFSGSSPNPNPSSATVIFTPLQEYKLRQTFATPYLVLTLYTDLTSSHGLVLLRGEITPSTSGNGDKFMLNQEDAQMLALSLQKFYLWSDANKLEEPSKGERLLRTFHESPQDFKWEELLEMSKSVI